MEVGILSSKPENRDDLTQVDSPELPPTHSSLNKINSRNIHSASFGSASSTCSSNSSSSLSTNGMAYTPAIRGLHLCAGCEVLLSTIKDMGFNVHTWISVDSDPETRRVVRALHPEVIQYEDVFDIHEEDVIKSLVIQITLL